MSSSSYRSGFGSSGGGGDGYGGNKDLRYQYKYCDCGKKVAIKIVDSEKPSKGMLYFVCQKNECRFFSWCIPILLQSNSDVGFRSNSDVGFRIDDGLTNKMQKIEEDVKNMKILVVGCCFIMMLMFVCTLKF